MGPECLCVSLCLGPYTGVGVRKGPRVFFFLCLSYPWEQGLSLIPELAYRPVSPRDPPISLSHRSVVVGM